MNSIIILLLSVVIVIAILRYLLSGRMSPYNDKIDLTGKVAMVTGSTSGCGKQIALAFARMGAKVIIASRGEDKCDSICSEIRQMTKKNESAEALPINLADLRDVERAAQVFLSKYTKLDILVNCGAVMATPFPTFTVQGYDGIIGTNYLSHFHLTTLLLPAIKNARGRIVNFGSVAHWITVFYNGFDFDALIHPKKWFWLSIYSQSKLAMILFARELQKRFGSDGIKSYVVCPGAVRTMITRHLPAWIHKIWTALPIARTAIEGAQCAIYCATAPENVLVPGGYYYDCKPAPLASVALNEETGKKLWDMSSSLVIPTKKEI